MYVHSGTTGTEPRGAEGFPWLPRSYSPDHLYRPRLVQLIMTSVGNVTMWLEKGYPEGKKGLSDHPPRRHVGYGVTITQYKQVINRV